MLVGRTRSQGAYGIDDDDARAVALGFTQEGHEMRRGTGWVASPNQDQLTLKQHLRSWSHTGPNSEQDSFFCCRSTYASFEFGSTHTIPEATVDNGVIEQSEGTRIAVWKDTLRTVICDDVMPT